MWRVAATGLLVLVGSAGVVKALEDEAQQLLEERARLQVDVWVRADSTLPGTGRHRLLKKSMVLLHGAGDIERTRVCLPAPVTGCMLRPSPWWCHLYRTVHLMRSCAFSVSRKSFLYHAH